MRATEENERRKVKPQSGFENSLRIILCSKRLCDPVPSSKGNTQPNTKMEITRNTMRADGITVGQAMDKDAAFLRSIGFDCKDGAPTIDEQRAEFREKCRLAVLAALDECAKEKTGKESDGPKTRELTKLFEAIDPISNRIFDI